MVSDAQNWIADRLTERSTWLGLLSILGATGIVVRPEIANQIVALGMAIGGFIGVIMKENYVRKW